MDDHQKYIQLAVEMARANVEMGEGGPFGALVVKDGQIVGRGVNCVTASNDPTAHAEIVAIRDACRTLQVFHLDGCDLYTSCEPCPMCLGAIYWARLRTIYFAASRRDAAEVNFSDAFIYEQIGVDPQHRVIPARRVVNPEALAVLRDWQLHDGKIEY